MDLKKFKGIHQRKKYLTFGYVRQAQGLLSKSCYNIPEIITYLVTLYLCFNEYFECHGIDLEISDDERSLKCKSIKEFCVGGNTAYGHIRINNTTK